MKAFKLNKIPYIVINKIFITLYFFIIIKKINSIKMSNEIKKDLLINTKKLLNNGVIIFIRENEFNLSELSSTITYIKSRGFTIVNINELLS